MKRVLHILFGLMFLGNLIGCTQNQADPNVVAAGTPEVVKPENPEPAKITIPEGTKLHIALVDGLSTAKSKAGQEFLASLTEPVVIEGHTVLPKGTKVKGRVTDVAASGHIKGRASIRLILTDIVRNGKDVSISTKPFVAVAEGTKKRDAEIIGGGAGVGALIGGLAGGGKGALVGAAVGGGAGTGTVIAMKGKEIQYPPETKLMFTLTSPVIIG